jgi:hypothetical protein
MAKIVDLVHSYRLVVKRSLIGRNSSILFCFVSCAAVPMPFSSLSTAEIGKMFLVVNTQNNKAYAFGCRRVAIRPQARKKKKRKKKKKGEKGKPRKNEK